MEFPEREEDLVDLALWIAEGIKQLPDGLPAPPVPAAELRARVDPVKAALAG